MRAKAVFPLVKISFFKVQIPKLSAEVAAQKSTQSKYTRNRAQQINNLRLIVIHHKIQYLPPTPSLPSHPEIAVKHCTLLTSSASHSAAADPSIAVEIERWWRRRCPRALSLPGRSRNRLLHLQLGLYHADPIADGTLAARHFHFHLFNRDKFPVVIRHTPDGDTEQNGPGIRRARTTDDSNREHSFHCFLRLLTQDSTPEAALLSVALVVSLAHELLALPMLCCGRSGEGPLFQPTPTSLCQRNNRRTR